jgi:hypothetical protein
VIGQPFRLEPQGPADLYKTYEAIRPRSTHTRAATCREVNCSARDKGWRTRVDLSSDLGKRQARYIRDHSGRAFTSAVSGVLLTFVFPAGQDCFAEHRVPLMREPVYRILGGDYRGNPRGVAPIVRRPADWVDDFGSHQIKLKEAHERG